MTSINKVSGAIPAYTGGSQTAPSGSTSNTVSSTDAPKKVVQAENTASAANALNAQAAQPSSQQEQLQKKTGENEDNAAQKTAKTTNEEIRKAVEALNKKMLSHSEAIFGIHDKTNRVTIKIVDKDSKEVIKEIPAEKTLDMLAKIWEVAGIMVDEKR